MYHHLLVYTVTLLGVFTTRWRKKPGCFLDVFFSFCDICRTVLQTPGSWVTKYIIIFIYSPHPFFERGWGWEIFHLVLHQFHMWGFQMKPNLALPVQKLFNMTIQWKQVSFVTNLYFFLLFLHFVFTPRDIKEYLSDIKWRLFTYFCNATIFERLTRQSRVPISIC